MLISRRLQAAGRIVIEYDEQAIAIDALLQEVKRAGYRPGPVTEISGFGPLGDAQSEDLADE